MTSSCLKLNSLLYLLFKDSCIIFILFFCYIQQLLLITISCSFTFFLSLPDHTCGKGKGSALWVHSLNLVMIMFRDTNIIFYSARVPETIKYNNIDIIIFFCKGCRNISSCCCYWWKCCYYRTSTFKRTSHYSCKSGWQLCVLFIDNWITIQSALGPYGTSVL